MTFEPMPYIEWAKSHENIKHSLGWSYAPQRSFAEVCQDFAVDPAKLQIWPEPLSNEKWYELAELIATRFGIARQQVLPTTSCTLANFLAIAAVLSEFPSDQREVLVEAPTYNPLVRQARAAGGRVRRITTWADGRLRPESLRQSITTKTALIIISNINNPTGSLMSPDELAEICDKAANHGAYVLVDEVYRDFISPDRIAPAVHCGPNALCTESLSKVHGLTQLKVGWILGPPRIIARAEQIYDHLGVNVPYVCRDIAVKVLGSHWEDIVSSARDFAAERLAKIRAFMEPREDVLWYEPAGGLVGLMVPHKVNAETLSKTMLEKYKTLIVPGRFFGLTNAVRLGVGGPDLDESLACLGQCLDELSNTKAAEKG